MKTKNRQPTNTHRRHNIHLSPPPPRQEQPPQNKSCAKSSSSMDQEHNKVLTESEIMAVAAEQLMLLSDEDNSSNILNNSSSSNNYDKVGKEKELLFDCGSSPKEITSRKIEEIFGKDEEYNLVVEVDRRPSRKKKKYRSLASIYEATTPVIDRCIGKGNKKVKY